jgi:D-alanyl-lipoteichoic acid acyltransferase DltB (MBOAT superfamily)
MAVQAVSGVSRDVLFALLNIIALYSFGLDGQTGHVNLAFTTFAIAVLAQYLMLYWFAEKPGWQPWLAFFTPIAILVAVRYFPAAITSPLGLLFPEKKNAFSVIYLVGVSYLAFRNSLLVLEIRNGKVKKPSLWQYLGYSFFVPTIPVGPINPYSNFLGAFQSPPPEIPLGRAALRILVGLVKYQFLGSLCNRLTYDGLLFDGHLHHWIDLPIAAIFYYLFLYCNFSGFCDMAIGAAGLMGVPVAENFNNPFAARNLKDFWNRWHITLSTWMRDVVFSPLSKFLVGKFGVALANHAIALTITIVFLLVGIWHGVGWNFAIYGAVHALGVVANHYYTVFLKKKLGREGFKAYNENRWIHAAAVVLTFCYCGASLVFFANTISQLKEIFTILR